MVSNTQHPWPHRTTHVACHPTTICLSQIFCCMLRHPRLLVTSCSSNQLLMLPFRTQFLLSPHSSQAIHYFSLDELPLAHEHCLMKLRYTFKISSSSLSPSKQDRLSLVKPIKTGHKTFPTLRTSQTQKK